MTFTAILIFLIVYQVTMRFPFWILISKACQVILRILILSYKSYTFLSQWLVWLKLKLRWINNPYLILIYRGTHFSCNLLFQMLEVLVFIQKMTWAVISELSTSTADYEALWIEIHNTHSLNILCGIICRHPNGNLESFLEYLNSTAEKIDRGRSIVQY